MLKQVKNKIKEYRNMQLKDKWQQESQRFKTKVKNKKKKYAVARHATMRIRTNEMEVTYKKCVVTMLGNILLQE